MNKTEHFRRRILSLSIVGTFIVGTGFWCLSQSSVHVTTFLQISFGEEKNQLGRLAIIDLYAQARPITVTGFLSFDERLNICLSDQRRPTGTGERFLFFDSGGQIKHSWLREDKTGTYSVCIALSPDGSVWTGMNFHSQQPSYYSPCVRKYDRTGRVALQFGEPRLDDKWAKPVSPQVKRALTKRYHHLWGTAYRFGSARIQGLWADRKGRVYVLTEYPSLHVFADDGKPLAVFDFIPNDKLTFEGDLGDLGGEPLFVDFDGRIYTYNVQNKWVEVWTWEPRLQKVRTATVPESGCVVGVDKEENIYYMSFFRDRIYRLSPDGKAEMVFEPKKHYQEWVEVERKVWVSRQPQKAQEYALQQWKEGKGSNVGPRTGHVCHVDKEGNLYLTLVGADYFRIDKISLR
jgi:hypothetical protein